MLEASFFLCSILCIPSFHTAFLIKGTTSLTLVAMVLVGSCTGAFRFTLGIRTAVLIRILFKVLFVKLITLNHLYAIFKCYISLRISYRFLDFLQIEDHFLLYTHD